MTAVRALVLGGGLLIAAAGCGREALSPEAERGRRIYLSQCTACHAADPSQSGPVGPEVKGASREVLEAKIVRGSYPPGHKPKRPTAVMPPQPQLGPDIPALAEFLK